MQMIEWFANIDASGLAESGGKGANLGELTRLGMPVPAGFVITTEAYRSFASVIGLKKFLETSFAELESEAPEKVIVAAQELRALFAGSAMPQELRDSIAAAFRQLGGAPVAVRSSATAEDAPAASFAGQQETYLNVSSEESLIDAVRRCWSSIWSDRSITYRLRQGIPLAEVEMAVVVQTMAEAKLAGVLFTADPITGDRDTIVIDAALGLGETVVAGEVTPDTIRVDKKSGRILTYDVGDKTTMIVPADDATVVQAVPGNLQREKIVDELLVASLLGYACQIEDHYGAAMDIEWAASEDDVAILQARPITALPEPTPHDWPIENPDAVYGRTSIAELLPDPLSPMFEELSLKAVNDAIEKLAREYYGGPRYENYHFLTINGYAFYANFFPAKVWWPLVTGSWRFVRQFMKNGEQLWRDVYRPRYAATVENHECCDPALESASDLITAVEEIVARSTEYYTVVQALLWSVVPSEFLFTRYYNKLVKRDDEPGATVFLLGEDSLPLRAEKSLYDLANWCRARPALCEHLLAVGAAEVPAALAGTPPVGADTADWKEWQSRFAAHLEDFGHLIYNLDLALPVPADEPGPIFETLRFYLGGGGEDPHERQSRTLARAEEAIQKTCARLGWLRRRYFLKLLRWARRCVPLREDALSDIGLGWPVSRRLLLELGRRLVDAGAASKADDVFWLRRDEILETLEHRASRSAQEARNLIDKRRNVWRARRRAQAPTLLPPGARLFGLDVDQWTPAKEDEDAGNSLTGIGVSPGQVSGPARVLHGPADFSQMKPGDILVASITTPAWTPLFAMASGVVTDIGGPLSHSSIVAREYGIPAVLGTGNATRTLKSGMRIDVDGDQGRVVFDELSTAQDSA